MRPLLNELVEPAPRGLVQVRDVPIRIRRDTETLEIEEAEICACPRLAHDGRPRQARWCIDGTLLPDEMILVFERPRDWIGQGLRKERALELTENVFPSPFTITRQKPEALSGIPRLPFPPGIDVVGWAYAAVLVRGEDNPWIRSALLRLRRQPD